MTPVRASFPDITHPPDGVIPIFAKEQAAIFRDGNADRPAPDVSFRGNEAGDEILVIAPGFSARFIERHAHDLVTGPPRLVP